MNPDHLKLFVRIAVLQNISLAGKELGLSAAVSSTYINKLEQDLGVRLIHRTTRKISLSQEGLSFLPHAHQVLEHIETAKASVGSGSLKPQGKLRVTAPASFGRMHLVPALRQFFDEYPNIQVDMYLSDHIVDMVEGGFDVAIRDAALNDSSLIARKLAGDKRIICASPDYLKRHGVPRHPVELNDHQCVNLMGIENWSFNTNEGVTTIKTQNAYRTDNGEAARDACIGGVGLTLTSTWCSYQHVQNGHLVPVLTNYPLVSNTAIWAVYPSSRLVAPKVRAFIDFFTRQFAGTPYWDQALENDS